DPQWRAAADYRAGNYQAAVDTLKGIDNAEADYNRGNALAKMGRLQEALQAYDAALKRDPKLDDAGYNRNLIKDLLKKQQQKKQANQAEKQQPDQKNSKNQQPSSKNGQQKNSAGQSQPMPPKSAQGDQQPDKKSDQSKSSQGEAGKQQPDTAHQQGNAANQAGAQPHNQATQKQEQDQAQPQPLPQATEQHASPSVSAQAATDAQAQRKQLQHADEQWLRRIPDDPGGLWRRKFLYQYKQQQQFQQSEKQPW
ncbi:MAG: tetratricopeptide repeat protein, partial [Sulfuriferula sp.]